MIYCKEYVELLHEACYNGEDKDRYVNLMIYIDAKLAEAYEQGKKDAELTNAPCINYRKSTDKGCLAWFTWLNLIGKHSLTKPNLVSFMAGFNAGQAVIPLPKEPA